MTEKLSIELRNFCRLYDELEIVRIRIKKIVSNILEEEINPLKFSCVVMTELLQLDGDETPNYIEVRVPVQDTYISLSILNSIKEKLGAVNIDVLARSEADPFEQSTKALIELRIALPKLLPVKETDS